jgi:anti-sigma factor RsiW
MSALPITEIELQAYVDGRLSPARQAEVEAYLAEHAEARARVAAYCWQNEALHAQFDAVLDEPVPARLAQRTQRRPRPLLRWAAVLASFVIGGAVGWTVHGIGGAGRPAPMRIFAHEAAQAYLVYAPEVRHPVEVGANQEAHLVAWLSKRLGVKLTVPDLQAVGYHLMGGRLLPGNKGPVAQFMYQDADGQRLTLYVSNGSQYRRETAFRFMRQGNVRVFYWIDERCGYALSGEISREQLLRVATAIYHQINP